MALDRGFFFSILGFTIGIVLFSVGFNLLRKKRLIENIPTSKVRSLAMGLVEIYGKVKLAEKTCLTSPLTASPCVYYKYTVEEYHHDKHGVHWNTILRGNDEQKFFLEDDTGRVLVDPEKAQVSLERDYKTRLQGLSKIPPSLENFANTKNLKLKNFLGGKRNLRFRESYISPDDSVYILGTAADNPYVDDATSDQNVKDIMIQRGKNDKIYYICDKHETSILKQLRLQSLGGIFGGAILSVACLAIILWYVGLL